MLVLNKTTTVTQMQHYIESSQTLKIWSAGHM